MKVSLSWLQEYISIEMDLDSLVNTLTMLGLEVESVSDRFSYLNRIFIGQIDKIKKHPRSDNFLLCKVNYGIKSTYIISAAKNLNVGIKIALAPSMTTMPNGDIIREKRILGETSYGMICSEYDLGISDNHKGVMLLKDNAVIGNSIKDYLSISDFVLDIALTPNRPDCSSIIGIAREISSVQKNKLKLSNKNLIDLYSLYSSESVKDDFVSLNINSPQGCSHYLAVLLENIEINQSPFWLRDRLYSVGLKPVNNIVDVTNFVMLETGQPLHAFDFDLLKEKKINVDYSKEGELFETLDNKELVLTNEILAIYDNKKVVSVAGVIGGENSKINIGTNRVFLEGANFDTSSIRKSSRILGVNTESSYRFERGIDPENILKALNRAVILITKLIPNSKIGGFIEKKSTLPVVKKSLIIELCIDKTNKLLGTFLNSNQISSILNSIGFYNRYLENKKLEVTVPSFRIDVKKQEDLIEEVARIYGYNNIPVTVPKISNIGSNTFEIKDRLDIYDKIKSVLNGIGFSEVINYSFSEDSSCDRLALPINDHRRRKVSILNPLSSVQSIMRTSLIPNLLSTVNKNISRQLKNLMFFEIGKVFISRGKKKRPDEIDMLTALWTGKGIQASWNVQDKDCDFFDIKGSLEELLYYFKIFDFKFKRIPKTSCYYMRWGHSSQLVTSKNNIIGAVGELSSKLLEAYSIKQRVFIFEIDVQLFLECKPKSIVVNPIPKFPYVSRDATIIVGEKIESSIFIDRINSMNESLVEKIRILNVYKGSSLQSSMKSISFRITYRSHNSTLDDVVINSLHKSIIDRLVNEFEAMLPSR